MLSLPVLTMEYKDALVSGVPAPSREALKTWLDSLEYETLIQPRERGPLVRTERLDTKMAMHMVQLSPGIRLDNFSNVHACWKVWRYLTDNVLRPSHPIETHRSLLTAAYRDWPEELGPPPVC